MNKWFAQFLTNYEPEEETAVTANFSVKFVEGRKIYIDQDNKTEHPVWSKEYCLEKQRAARDKDPYLEHALVRIEKYAEAAKEKGKMHEMMAKDNAAIFKLWATWLLQNESSPEIQWEALEYDKLLQYTNSPDQGIVQAALYEIDRRDAEEKLKQEEQAQALDQVFDATPPQPTPEPAKKSLFGKPKKGLFSK